MLQLRNALNFALQINIMRNFKIVPISKGYAYGVKKAQKNDFGHALEAQLATGLGPCRVSLKPFAAGQHQRLLLSYSPFETDNAFNQPGPVFIHQEDVEAYTDIHRFPPEIKADKENFPLTLIGYNKNQQMIYTKLAGNSDADDLIEAVFETHPAVEYLHARNAEAGCFICKIERV